MFPRYLILALVILILGVIGSPLISVADPSIEDSFNPIASTMKISNDSDHPATLNIVTIDNPQSARTGLKLAWALLPIKKYQLVVRDVRKDGLIPEVFEQINCPGSPVIVSGGFFGFGQHDDRIPLGLVISGSHHLSPAIKWSSGGVIISEKGKVRVISIRDVNGTSSFNEAIQSKPIIVQNYENGIHSDQPPPANRVVIGTTDVGDIVVVGAFGNDGLGLTLYEMAQAVLALPKFGGPRIQNALALDGGPGAHFFFPDINTHFGYSGASYVPNALCFIPRR